MEWKSVTLLLCVLVILPVSHTLPLDRPNFDLQMSRSTAQNSTRNPVVQVIVSSSSSSRSYVGGPSYHHTIHHHHQLPTTPPINFHPTTYHPQLPKFPPFQPIHQHFPQSPFEWRQNPFTFENRRHNLLPTTAVEPTSPTDDIFSVFYNSFSQHNSAESLSSPSPAPPVPSVPAPIISVVSQSHSVSSSEVTVADHYKNRKHLTRPLSRMHMAHRRSNDAVNNELPKATNHFRFKAKPFYETVDDAFMYQGDQPYVTQEKAATEQSNLTETTNWENSEKVWGEPEKVWGEAEQNWEIAETWEPQKETSTPPSSTLPVDEEVTSPSDDDDTPMRFYELGEDEDDEPKELILDKNTMSATIETAQLAARSWELPELSHLGLIPNQSFVRTSSDGMVSESIQIPFRTNASMPKIRMTLDSSRSKSIKTELESSVLPDKLNGKKFGYVLDGSNVRKYRVEERTPDGYIVGEYGVLNQSNGFLRGVRYTADGTINPRLIHEALMKFLAL